MLWSGLVSQVGASHSVNLITPLPLGHNCRRKIARIHEHEIQYDGLSWHHKLHCRKFLLSSFHLNKKAAVSVWLWVRSQTLLIITIEMINRKLNVQVRFRNIPAQKSPRQCFQPLCGFFGSFLQLQFLFTGRTLTVLTVRYKIYLYTYTVLVTWLFCCMWNTGIKRQCSINWIQLPFQWNITRCFGLLSSLRIHCWYE